MAKYATDLGIGDYIVFQDTDDYAFSQDSVFLANTAKIGSNDRVLDLGCGCAILSTLALVKKHAKNAVGIELQSRVADMAKESTLRNGLDDKLEIICGDVKDIRNLVKAESFDKVLCNPPYFANGNLLTDKNLSRTESSATLDDFVKAAAYALRFGGDLWIVIKADRLASLIYSLKAHNLEPKEAIIVYPKPSSDADVVIIKARKGAKEGLKISSFFVTDESGNYTDKYKEMYA